MKPRFDGEQVHADSEEEAYAYMQGMMDTRKELEFALDEVPLSPHVDKLPQDVSIHLKTKNLKSGLLICLVQKVLV